MRFFTVTTHLAPKPSHYHNSIASQYPGIYGTFQPWFQKMRRS